MSAVNALFTFTLAVSIAGLLGLAAVAYMTWRASQRAPHIVESEQIAPGYGGQAWRERGSDGREYVRSVARRRPWEPLRLPVRGLLGRMLTALSGRF